MDSTSGKAMTVIMDEKKVYKTLGSPSWYITMRDKMMVDLHENG